MENEAGRSGRRGGVELAPGVYAVLAVEDLDEYKALRRRLSLAEDGLDELRLDAERYVAKADIERLIGIQGRHVSEAWVALRAFIERANLEYRERVRARRRSA